MIRHTTTTCVRSDACIFIDIIEVSYIFCLGLYPSDNPMQVFTISCTKLQISYICIPYEITPWNVRVECVTISSPTRQADQLSHNHLSYFRPLTAFISLICMFYVYSTTNNIMNGQLFKFSSSGNLYTLSWSECI